MGTFQSKRYTNCIKERFGTGYYRVFEQFDDNGNMAYTYKHEKAMPNGLLKVAVYNSQGSIVGTINKEVIGFHVFRFSLYDENN